MIKFLPLGGADEIGASCFYLNIDGTGILLDCGIHPRKSNKESLPKFELISNEPLDFVFISHAHQDHIGALPFLTQEYPYVIIYSTYQTKEIANITLHNAANILASENIFQNELRNFTHEEIELLVKSIRDVEYNLTFEVEGLRHFTKEKIKITFLDAGHILGSAAILIEYGKEKIVYTGDINIKDQALMLGSSIINFSNCTTLIMETTYGATDSVKIGTWVSESKRFARLANKIINNGGSILIPVFALGKAQEIFATIHQLMQNNFLTETQIYTGGIGKEITKIYDSNRYIVNYKSPDLSLRNIPQLNFLDINDLNYFKKNPGIILASSGMMLKGTNSFKLMKYWLQQKSFAIFSVGYMDVDTPGYNVINSGLEEVIYFEDENISQKKLCSVEKFYFSSHSKREDLLGIVENLKPIKIILTHGEVEAQRWIGGEILKRNNNIKLYAAEVGKEIEI